MKEHREGEGGVRWRDGGGRGMMEEKGEGREGGGRGSCLTIVLRGDFFQVINS